MSSDATRLLLAAFQIRTRVYIAGQHVTVQAAALQQLSETRATLLSRRLMTRSDKDCDEGLFVHDMQLANPAC
jgi:hypothetical protein